MTTGELSDFELFFNNNVCFNFMTFVVYDIVIVTTSFKRYQTNLLCTYIII